MTTSSFGRLNSSSLFVACCKNPAKYFGNTFLRVSFPRFPRVVSFKLSGRYVSQTMSNIEQPCGCLSVQGMKRASLYSSNVSVLSSGRDALSLHHRTRWRQNKRVFLVRNVVHCNATYNVLCSLVDASHAVTMLAATDGFHVQ